MKIGSILKTVGAGLLSTHPLGAAAIGLVNGFLPADKKLPESTTGEQAQSVIESLPPEQRQTVMVAEIEADVEHDREWTKRFDAMTKAAGWGWVRPMIVIEMAQLIVIAVLYYLYILYRAVESSDSSNLSVALTAVGQTWPIIAAALSFPMTIVISWFGHRERAKQRAAESAHGAVLSPMTGMVGTVISALRGK
jgi:cytochrome c-type biogenesis protein CcmH/NrfG